MNSKEHGLYSSSTPSSAARKAVSKLCADNKNKKVEFSIRETTQNSNKKVYGPYLGFMQKLDKPVELEGRVIRYKPIVKLNKKVNKMKDGGLRRNNQIGGSLKVGDRVKSLIKIMIGKLISEGKENIYIVKKIFPKNLGTILIQHIDGGSDICLNIDKVEKIESDSASSAASAPLTESENKIWEELLSHVTNENKNNDDWFIIKNDYGDYVKVKKNGKSDFVMINHPGNENWTIVESNSKLPNTGTFVVNVKTTFGGNKLYQCPICNAQIIKNIYNRNGTFPHKVGCKNIGKIPREGSH